MTLSSHKRVSFHPSVTVTTRMINDRLNENCNDWFIQHLQLIQSMAMTMLACHRLSLAMTFMTPLLCTCSPWIPTPPPIDTIAALLDSFQHERCLLFGYNDGRLISLRWTQATQARLLIYLYQPGQQVLITLRSPTILFTFEIFNLV